MKTISIRLEDSIYEELDEMLDAMGQTKQTFYETFTRTALRERRQWMQNTWICYNLYMSVLKFEIWAY